MMPQPGDYGVERTTGLHADAIKFATRSEFGHAFVVGDDGQVIEAAPGGARLVPLGKRNAIYSSDVIPVADSIRKLIVSAAIGLIGTPYGWLDIVSIGLLQYGIRPQAVRDRVQREDKLICSQLVDETYRLAGVHLFADGRLPMDVTPGNLAARIGYK